MPIMHRIIPKLLVFTATLVVLSQSCHAGWNTVSANDDGKALIDTDERRKRRQGKHEFIVSLANGSLMYADIGSGIMRLEGIEGKIIEYRDRLEEPNGRREWKEIRKAKDKREDYYRREPVIETITNILPYKDSFVVIHNVPVRHQNIRIVQIVDGNLEVISSWEDGLVIQKRKGNTEPISISDSGIIAAKGEKGEILLYNNDGQIVRRLVMPGIFNSSRTIEPVGFDEDKHSYMSKSGIDAIKQTREYTAKKRQAVLDLRDSTLPKPRLLQGKDMPEEIREVVFLSDNRLLVMDEKDRFHEIDVDDSSITTIRIQGIIQRDYGGAKETIHQLRYVRHQIFMQTTFRIFQVDPNKEYVVIGENDLPRGASYLGWDITYPKSSNLGKPSDVNPLLIYIDNSTIRKKELDFVSN